MPEPPRRIHFIADRRDARLRLDQVLVRRVTEVTRMSRSRAQAWIQAGAVLVDGSPALRPASRVREGVIVEVALPASTALRVRPGPEDRALEILYEDAHLVAINKPTGIVVHPSFKNVSGTILNAVLGRFRDRAGVRPGIVTRLDKETSGVLLVALTPGIHARLQRSSVRKRYLAIVAGTPAPARGTIELSLGRDALDRRRVAVVSEGLPSATRYEVLSAKQGVSLVRCELLTGRTHQIRVHLAARGWPIVGDAIYGIADHRIARVALHASCVQLDHPVTGQTLEILAPLPPDMRAFDL
ncbi:MAG: RluA family pseudouridine synthase [Vicinamibacterales bacterium]